MTGAIQRCSGVRATGGSFAFRSSSFRGGRSRVLMSFQCASGSERLSDFAGGGFHRGGGFRVRVLDDFEKGREDPFNLERSSSRARGRRSRICRSFPPERRPCRRERRSPRRGRAVRRLLLERSQLRAERLDFLEGGEVVAHRPADPGRELELPREILGGRLDARIHLDRQGLREVVAPAVSRTVYWPGRTHGPSGWRGVSWRIAVIG